MSHGLLVGLFFVIAGITPKDQQVSKHPSLDRNEYRLAQTWLTEVKPNGALAAYYSDRPWRPGRVVFEINVPACSPADSSFKFTLVWDHLVPASVCCSKLRSWHIIVTRLVLLICVSIIVSVCVCYFLFRFLKGFQSLNFNSSQYLSYSFRVIFSCLNYSFHLQIQVPKISSIKYVIDFQSCLSGLFLWNVLLCSVNL